MKKVAVTFDLDLADYVGGGMVEDEFQSAWPVFLQFCNAIPGLKTTWFIRIDEHMKIMHGAEDYIFQTHADKIQWLKDNGHEVGWHFHSYRKQGGKWKQNPNEFDVAEELKRVFLFVQKYNLKIMRMGWAYHTNVTMKTIASLGVKMDCTAMPRPAYTWEKSLRNWTGSGQEPYFPSIADYRIAGNPAYNLLEVPIHTLPIEASYDTEPGVLRYLNPAYHQDIFKTAINAFTENHLNVIAHPYEFLPNNKSHGMLSFSSEVFLNNLKLLEESFQFLTISEWTKSYQNNK